MAPNTIVRCSAGHQYTATWTPLIYIRSVRFTHGRRFTRCPVKRHWGVVAKIDSMNPGQAELASAQSRDAGL
ncbi:hypothetical protein GCM10010339_74230 [Streptomyces alanosinicus]|uniref:Uncharacterized protein n=1 Tax=Streptomyces alanosinicus TaxID=68171 RepID=A0A919D802_9ACTN|nr:hypothetical protein GCM10010339_74230 [Streptomyces alanosinicus]